VAVNQQAQDSGESTASASGQLLAAGMAVACAVAFAWGVTLIERVAAGDAVTVATSWVPAFNVRLAFHIDGLALLFLLLVTGIGTLIAIYTATYFRGDSRLPRLILMLMAFTVAMLGVVLTDDVVLLFIFWELTTVTSFLLVGFDREKASARRAALQALWVTAAGGLLLLIGLLLLADVTGTRLLSEMVAAGTVDLGDPRAAWALALVLLGAFTKSAQMPFHFWLPGAMSAPTPVSAFLHSATMVKAGIYLLARVQPAFGEHDVWFYTLTSIGALTAVWASMMALRQNDAKLMLAWTTVMALGILTLFLGSNERIAVLAAMTFLVVHAFYKCAMFLVIGNVDHGTGTRQLDQLGGLFKPLPITGVVAIAAGFSMAGFPPFLGFIGKELKYEGALAIAEEPLLIAAAALAANAMMVAVALTLVRCIFLSGQANTPRTPHEAPWGMWLPPLVLAVGGLVAGIFPEHLLGGLVQAATSGVLAEDTEVKLKLWHGVNLPLMMSVLTVIIGIVLHLNRQRIHRMLDGLVAALPFTLDPGWDSFLRGFDSVANALVSRIQTGRLGHYLMVIFVTVVVAGGVALASMDSWSAQSPQAALTPVVTAIVVLMMFGALTTIVSESRMLSIGALGLVGSGAALVFFWYGAIDVAITQLLVETLFVVLIAAVLARLPRLSGDDHTDRRTRVWHGVLAVGTGTVIGLATWLAATRSTDHAVARYYESASLPEAYGANVVNVVLVDFRALDTLGEVAVVVAAALAVVGVLTRVNRTRASASAGEGV